MVNCKISTSRSPTTDRQPKEVHGISTHYMPTTANRFEILSDLSEDGNRFKPVKEPRGYPRCQQRKSDHEGATPWGKYYCSDTEIKQHACTKHDSAINGNLKNSTRKIPLVINGLTSLTARTSTNRRKHASSSQQNKHHKIIIISDSHARGASSNLQHNLDTTFGPSGFVSPGANMNSLISSVTSDIKHLRSKDVMVLSGGTNDVCRNNSQDALKHITTFVKANGRTNIIILCVPHRHNLPEWSCVNKEVEAFNRKLVKLMKPYKHVTVVKVDLDREFFTRHGQHMNNLGNKKIALSIARVVTDLFSNQEETISLHWKDDYEVRVSESSDEDATTMQEDPKAVPSKTTTMEVLLDEAIQENQTDNDSAETGINKEDIAILGLTQDITGDTQSAGIDKTIESRRTPTRNKKPPSIRGNDFFMGNRSHNSENGINTIKPTNSKNLFKIFHQNILLLLPIALWPFQFGLGFPYN